MNNNLRKTENVVQNKPNGSKYMHHTMILTAIVSIIALIVAMLTHLYKDTISFWYDYICGIRGGAWLVFFIGIVILSFKTLKYHTDFFKITKPITPEKFSSTILSILTITIILIVLAMTFLPEEKASESERGPSLKYEVIKRKQKKNFRFFVATFIMMSGLAVASVPIRRFIRK